MRTLLLSCALMLIACGGSTPPMNTADLGSADGGGTKVFGDVCTALGTPGDCAPDLICEMFLMGAVYRCTRLCDQNPNPTNCPAPSVGTCTPKDECKFTM
jgi:hypothetical protein